jgi:hypothetical protein
MVTVANIPVQRFYFCFAVDNGLIHGLCGLQDKRGLHDADSNDDALVYSKKGTSRSVALNVECRFGF